MCPPPDLPDEGAVLDPGAVFESRENPVPYHCFEGSKYGMIQKHVTYPHSQLGLKFEDWQCTKPIAPDSVVIEKVRQLIEREESERQERLKKLKEYNKQHPKPLCPIRARLDEQRRQSRINLQLQNMEFLLYMYWKLTRKTEGKATPELKYIEHIPDSEIPKYF